MKKLLTLIAFTFLAQYGFSQNDSLKIVRVDKKPAIVTTKKINLQSVESRLLIAEKKLKEVTAILQNIQKETETVTELTSEQQTKIQMLMERLAKAEAAASNAMKKFSETASSIIGNIK